jgi:hypothetical protein
MNDSFNDTYNWGPLGRSFWSRASVECNATPLQTRFACAKLRNPNNNAAAAREAGVARAARSIGYAMARNAKVIAMLTMAQTAGSKRPNEPLQDARPDGEMTGAEAKSILTDIARADEPVLKIRAVEALQKIIDQEQQRDRKELSLEEAFERARKAAGEFGAQFLVEAFFNEHKSLPWACEPFVKLVPMLALTFPDRWRDYQRQLPGHKLKFQEVGLAG